MKSLIAALALSTALVAPSLALARPVKDFGDSVSHTMDPRRGAPLVAAPASVTVLSRSCMLADAMATALMVMGDKRGPDFAEDHAISALFLLRVSGETVSVCTGVFAST